MTTASTPGAGGYLAAWVVSVVVFAALFAGTTSVAQGTGLDTALGVFVIYGYLIGAFSIPFALVGVGLVHATCRRVRRQWVHVLAAGIAGVFPSLLLVALLGGRDAFAFALIPVATAIGRWSVVPLVRRRRESDVSPGARAAS